jgi:hypothetical protein
MKYPLILLLIILLSYNTYAQKGIEKFSTQKIDSLQYLHVDTIIHYYSYCGECEVLSKHNNCSVLSGYVLIDNVLLYKQCGKYYTLTFDCSNNPIKRTLDSCKSLPYYLAIRPTLYARDKTIKAMIKKGRFLGPSVADGEFENADIYVNYMKQSVSMSESEKTDLYKIYRKYFWIDKQIKLLKLIKGDMSVNN